MFVTSKFALQEGTVKRLKAMTPNWGYGAFSEFLFYRTYSRLTKNGQETWADVVIRVIEGIFSIRKNYCIKNHIPWFDPDYWDYANNMALSMFNMQWLPPGRGLWAMGTDYIYQRGSLSLYNCAATELNRPEDFEWLMDCLMCGVGVGFAPIREDDLTLYNKKQSHYTYKIADSKEGWIESIKILLHAFWDKKAILPLFDYSLIRPKGQLIKGFGGIASGPEALIKLHSQLKQVCLSYINGEIDSVQLKTDIANLIGCCVVSGNVRRSAEIAIGDIEDEVFLNLKSYETMPYRETWGWMSNNSVTLKRDTDFNRLGEIAQRVINNGEPGFINLRNFKNGRIGKKDNVREDKATLINPCGEIPLENKETCNVAETFPTRCENVNEWLYACEYATFYCSTITLLPTHRPETNSVVNRNRRIGVGLVDFTGWKQDLGLCTVINYMRKGYEVVRKVNKTLADQVGIPESIRVTTIKPGGTVPKIAGKTSGISHPTFIYTLRRVRVAENSPIVDVLKKANIPNERDLASDNTLVFEFPIKQGPSLPAKDISLWEQAMNLITVQREWADNAVSNTLYFKESELNSIEHVLSAIAPITKSVSLLPVSEEAYEQMPESELSIHEYTERLQAIGMIDWSNYSSRTNVETDRYCDGDKCERIQ